MRSAVWGPADSADTNVLGLIQLTQLVLVGTFAPVPCHADPPAQSSRGRIRASESPWGNEVPG